MKICMAQINTLVGDIAANAQRVIDGVSLRRPLVHG